MKQIVKSAILAVLLSLTVAACVDGFKDEQIWESTVQNQQLKSPNPEKIAVVFSPDGATQTISWEVVPGAGGYKVSVYNVDDTTNIVPIIKDVVVDGVTLKNIPSFDDTKFKVEITALGNEQMNNTEALAPTAKTYTNMVPTTAVIPDGEDLTTYFAAHPLAEADTTDVQQCYELLPGGKYKMSGNIDFGLKSAILRGDKVLRPKPVITVSGGSFVSAGGAVALKFVNLDYTSSSSDLVVMKDEVLNADKVAETSTSKHLLIVDPFILQGCNIKGMKGSILNFTATRLYAIATFLIKDCIIGYSTVTKTVFDNGGGGGNSTSVKDLVMTNTTFYSEAGGATQYFIRMHGATAAEVFPTEKTKAVWGSGNLNILNCTFYQMCEDQELYNSNGKIWQGVDKRRLEKCVFVKSFACTGANTGKGGQAIYDRWRRGTNAENVTISENTYWSVNGNIEKEANACAGALTSDPGLVLTGSDPFLETTPLFTMSGSAQLRARVGDSKWLPAE
jgi:hypothetical protein